MKIPFQLLVSKAAESLSRDVAPHLSDDYARGQVFAVVNLLQTLALRGDWSTGFFSSQLRLQTDRIAAVRDLLEGCPGAPAAGPGPRADPHSIDDIFAGLEAGNRTLVDMWAWLGENRDRLDDARRRAVEAAIETALKDLNEREWRHVAPQMLARMSGPAT